MSLNRTKVLNRFAADFRKCNRRINCILYIPLMLSRKHYLNVTWKILQIAKMRLVLESVSP